jgi:hypothetical protein
MTAFHLKESEHISNWLDELGWSDWLVGMAWVMGW